MASVVYIFLHTKPLTNTSKHIRGNKRIFPIPKIGRQRGASKVLSSINDDDTICLDEDVDTSNVRNIIQIENEETSRTQDDKILYRSFHLLWFVKCLIYR